MSTSTCSMMCTDNQSNPRHALLIEEHDMASSHIPFHDLPMLQKIAFKVSKCHSSHFLLLYYRYDPYDPHYSKHFTLLLPIHCNPNSCPSESGFITELLCFKFQTVV